MEKRVWIMPQATVENFEVTEYIAACGDKTDPVYLFTCNAGGGAYGGAWQESNGVPGLQSKSSGSYWDGSYVPADKQITNTSSSFHACDITHEVNIDPSPEFLQNCYYKRYGASDKDAVSCIIWTGERNNNVHCCTGVTDVGSLPIAKS